MIDVTLRKISQRRNNHRSNSTQRLNTRHRQHRSTGLKFDDWDDTLEYGLTGRKFHKSTISWRISKYPSYLSNSDVNNVVSRAFRTWSAASPISFEQVYNDDVDIDIQFMSSGYDTSCSRAFSYGTLAHCLINSTPRKIHFNGNMRFTLGFGKSFKF